MAKTLKEMTGKTIADLANEYKELMKNVDLYHDSLEAHARELSIRVSIVEDPDLLELMLIVKMLREAEFASDRWFELMKVYNAICSRYDK